jgi:cupin fold WbuC family metalloprotein
MNFDAQRVQLIDAALLAEVLRQARKSPRLRMNYNFHARDEENPNRFLNAILRGSYIAPHRHLNPPKPEAFVVVEGRVAFFIFDDAGAVAAVHFLGREPGDALGIDQPPGVWHTLAALTPHAVCYEVKPGPYAPAGKDFAPLGPTRRRPPRHRLLKGVAHPRAHGSSSPERHAGVPGQRRSGVRAKATFAFCIKKH